MPVVHLPCGQQRLRALGCPPQGCGGPWGCCWFTGEGVSAGNPRAGVRLQVVDPVSPRQAVACAILGPVSTHWCVRLVSRSTGCQDRARPQPCLGLESARWWLTRSREPQREAQVPAPPPSACAGVRGWLSGLLWARGLIRQPVQLGRGMGTRPARLVAGPEASHAVCCWGPGAAGTGLEGGSHRGAGLQPRPWGVDQLPVWLPPVSCPECHSLASRETRSASGSDLALLKSQLPPLGQGVCEALCACRSRVSAPHRPWRLLEEALLASKPGILGARLPSTGLPAGEPSAPLWLVSLP